MSQESGMTDWASLHAPSLAEFEELAAEAFMRLPAPFRGLCEGVVVRVEDRILRFAPSYLRALARLLRSAPRNAKT